MKTVRMRELVEQVSEIYRAEMHKIQNLKQDMYSIDTELGQAERTKGKDITLERYNFLIRRRATLQKEIDTLSAHSQGIYDTRELLMDFGFDAKVSE